MSDSIKLRTKVIAGRAEIRMLLRHPMDVGRRLKNGKVIPPHFISELTCRYEEEIVMQAHWGAGVSKNPYVAFTVNNASKGGVLTIEWLDNQGNTDRLDYTL
ncbi:MAG: thiosulfate oxidation carrier complex protein SoxZ [Gammaproteobacteria bacterium]